MLPLILGGDPKQLPPAVMTTTEEDKKGNVLNRFAADGKVSAQMYLQYQGLPVFRLKTQLRMAKGMFDIPSSIFYKDVPFRYGDGQDIELEKFKLGRDLEDYLVKIVKIKPSPKGTLSPAFVHCPKSVVITDPCTGSKRSADQVKVALDLILDFLNFVRTERQGKPNAKDPFDDVAPKITIITPYTANLKEFDKKFRQESYRRLGRALPPPSTIDSFQGQENDIVVVVMGTKSINPGPGFTTDPQRLNVMLTRMTCGLVVVGDINVAGHLVGKPRFKGNVAPGRYHVQRPGEELKVRKNGLALFSFCQAMKVKGRVEISE